MTKPRAKELPKFKKASPTSKGSRLRKVMSSMDNIRVAMVNKSPMQGRPTQLRVTIKSNLPEFINLDVKKVAVRIEVTWMEFLKSRNVAVYKTQHMIKTPKTIGYLDDPISKTLEAYSRSCRFINATIVPYVSEIIDESIIESPGGQDQVERLSLEEISDEDDNDSDTEPFPGFAINNANGNNPSTSGNTNFGNIIDLRKDHEHRFPTLIFPTFMGESEYSISDPQGQFFGQDVKLRNNNFNWNEETELHPPNFERKNLKPIRFFGNLNSTLTDSLNMTCVDPPSPVNLMSTPAMLRVSNQSGDFMKNLFRFGRPNRMAPPLEESGSSSHSQDDEMVEDDDERQNLKDQVINEFRKIPLEDLLKMKEELVAMQNENRRYQWSRHAPMTSCAILSSFRL